MFSLYKYSVVLKVYTGTNIIDVKQKCVLINNMHMSYTNTIGLPGSYGTRMHILLIIPGHIGVKW